MAFGRYHHEIERTIATNCPTSEQLFELAKLGMGSARRHHRLQHLKRVKKAHFFTQEVHTVEPILHEDDDDKKSFIRHRMAGRIGKTALGGVEGVPKWSLKFFDAYWVEREGGQWQAERSMYRFEWDRNRVTMADRHMRFLRPSNQPLERDMYDEIDRFVVADDEAAIWHVRNELGLVTYDDCELLLEDTRRYYQQADQVLKAA